MRPEKLDIKRALRNPEETFGTPECVLSDPRLDREGKRAILKSWEQDERELAVAKGEGMVREEQNMLQRVLRALHTVSGSEVENKWSITKKGDHATGNEAEPSLIEALPLVKDLMRKINEVVHVNQTLHEAYFRMQSSDVPFLPVVDGDEIVGILTVRDIYGEPERVEKVIKPAKVRDHLSKDIAFCYEDDNVEMAREVMHESGRHRLLVTDDQQYLVGLITLETITAALREHGHRRPSVPKPETTKRIADTVGHATGGEPGKPKTYAVKPKIKKK